MSFLEPVPVATAAAMVARLAGVSVVVPESVEGTVTLRAEDRDAESIFRELAASVGANVRLEDGGSVLFSVGSNIADEFGIFETGMHGPEYMREVMKLLPDVSVRDFGSRVVTAGPPGSAEDAARLAELIKGGRDAWLVEVGVLRVSMSWLREFGVSWSAAGGAQLSLDAGVGHLGGSVPIMGVAADALARAAFAATRSESYAEIVASSTLYVVEDGEARLQQGEVVPIPIRTVSPQGTVSTTGYEYVETGLTIDIAARRIERGVLLDVSPSISSVVGFVESAPTVAQSTVEVTVVAEPERWLVLAGLESMEMADGRDGLGIPGLPRSGNSSDRSSRLLVCLRATRVFGEDGVISPPEVSGVMGPQVP